MQINVHIADARVSADPADVLATFSLGSCIGVTVYDPARRVAGLLHFQLPTAGADAEKARQKPFMYADTGMAGLLAEMARHGAADKKRLRVGLVGGAQMLDNGGFFDIGKRNHTGIRKVLWQHGMFIAAEQVGGSIPRTVFMSVADGDVVVKSGGQVVTT